MRECVTCVTLVAWTEEEHLFEFVYVICFSLMFCFSLRSEFVNV